MSRCILYCTRETRRRIALLLEAIERMTEEEWQKLRADMKDDDAIMGLLDVIGEQKGWA